MPVRHSEVFGDDGFGKLVGEEICFRGVPGTLDFYSVNIIFCP